MKKGFVKWFNNTKGFGFIVSEKGNEDTFVHYSAIEFDGYKSLEEGEEVEFEDMKGPKGLVATRVIKVGRS